MDAWDPSESLPEALLQEASQEGADAPLDAPVDAESDAAADAPAAADVRAADPVKHAVARLDAVTAQAATAQAPGSKTFSALNEPDTETAPPHAGEDEHAPPPGTPGGNRGVPGAGELLEPPDGVSVRRVHDWAFDGYAGERAWMTRSEQQRFDEQQRYGTTYGEITFEGSQLMLEALDLQPGSVIYDLGSGNGRFVAQALLGFPVSRAVGVELLETRFNRSCSALHRLDGLLRRDFAAAQGKEKKDKATDKALDVPPVNKGKLSRQRIHGGFLLLMSHVVCVDVLLHLRLAHWICPA